MSLITAFQFGVFGIENISAIMLKIVAAVVILLFGIIIANIASRLFRKVLHSFEINKVLAESGLKFPFEEFASSILKYIIYFAGIIWALSEIGLATTILQIILIVILIIMILFIILAFKDVIPNITAGFFVHSKGVFKEGDNVKIGSVEGKIIAIEIMETRIKTKSNDLVIVPNSVLMKSEITVKKKK